MDGVASSSGITDPAVASTTAPPGAEAMIYHTDPYTFFRFSEIETVRCADPQKVIDAIDSGNADSGEDYLIARALIDDDQQNGSDTLDTIIRGRYNRLSSYQKKQLENAAAAEQSMKAIIAKSKVKVTESHCHSTIRKVYRSKEDAGSSGMIVEYPGSSGTIVEYPVSSGISEYPPRLSLHIMVMAEPRRLVDDSTKDDGFLDWMGLSDEMDGESNKLEPVLRNFLGRIAGPDNFPGVHDYVDLLEWIDQESDGEFYNGHRDFLEPVFRQHWKRMAEDFLVIPEETAKWSVERVDFEGILMPVLQDENHLYLSCPTSAYILPQTKELTMPTPYQSRNFGSTTVGDDSKYDHGIWFEATDNGVFHGFPTDPSKAEGGTFVMGVDDEVLIFTIDSVGDCIRCRWKCHIDQWKRMWESAFGATTIRIDELN